MTRDTSGRLESEFEFEFEFGGDIDGEIPESVDESALRRMRTVALVLDESVRVPGTSYRVGIDPILGILPVSGDIVGGGLSLYIVLESARLGVSYTTLLKMLANVAIDVSVGAIPVVGGVFDAVWKANKRNLKLAIQDLATASSEGESTEASAGDEEVVEIPVE